MNAQHHVRHGRVSGLAGAADIDLRGFLGIDPAVRSGCDQLRHTVHIRGNGTPEQFGKIHRAVMVTSPDYFNLARAIPLKSRLAVD